MGKTRYCYVNSLKLFLEENKTKWMDNMKKRFDQNLELELGDLQITAWEDCFDSLTKYLKDIKDNFKNFNIIFEYELPFEGGRRPDVLLVSEEYVIVLEFKMKGMYEREDLDQVEAYARDLSEYHFESREKTIIPILVVTKGRNLKSKKYDSGVIACPVEELDWVLNKVITKEVTSCDIKEWIESKYEPLPTIVEAARKFMNNEDLPNIRRVNSTGIPEAIDELTRITIDAKENKKHVLALVTGVPGAGKTFLGLKYVYDICANNAKSESVYLSGNGPLVAVLQDALNSKSFVNEAKNVVGEFQKGRVKEYGKHILVFDEGQRAWDAKQMHAKRGINKSEADVLVEAVDKHLDWAVLLILVGEGQSIHNGENGGLKLWSSALSNVQKEWTVVGPNKLLPIFSNGENVIAKECFNLTVSLRTKLASDVSNFVNFIFQGNFNEATQLVEGIRHAGFKMYVTRNINIAKEYCKKRYYGNLSKRYGLVASSKAFVLAKYGLKPGFHGGKNIGIVVKWFNAPSNDANSCCQLKVVLSEYDCQGLEVDMPIVCWGNDFLYNDIGSIDGSNIFCSQYNLTEEEKVYRENAYRVLMTRGRDGMILFLPPDEIFDDTYMLFKSLGMRDI